MAQNKASQKPRKPKRKAALKPLTDVEFLQMYFELGERGSELARRLKISAPAVTQRLKRIGLERIDEARRAGVTSMSVAVSVSSVQTQQAAFDNGVARGVECLDTIHHLNECAKRQFRILEILDREFEERHTDPRKKIMPHHVSMYQQVTRELRGLAIDAVRVKKDLFNAEGIMVFYKAAVQIMEEEALDVRLRIYRKLAAMGSSEQHTALYPDSIETTGELTGDHPGG